jgi:hypothetical protein
MWTCETGPRKFQPTNNQRATQWQIFLESHSLERGEATELCSTGLPTSAKKISRSAFRYALDIGKDYTLKHYALDSGWVHTRVAQPTISH